MTMKKSVVKKAQMGKSVKPTADSTKYFSKKAAENKEMSKSFPKYSVLEIEFRHKGDKAQASADRQKMKGKPGHDADGYPLTKFRPKSPKQQISQGVKSKKK
jgi:hypothetical protein